MSCCGSCQQQSGLGALVQFYGLRGLGAVLAAGSEVKVGFAYNLQTTSEEAFQGYGEPSYIQEVLKGALLGSGAFQYVSVIVTPPAYAGLQDGYILIQGTTWTDRPYAEEIGDLSEELIRDYLPTVVMRRRDPVHVLSVPPTASGKAGVIQPYDPTKTAPQNPSGPKTECKWSAMEFGEYVACLVGIKDATTGALAGATGAILGVAVITGVALVLLKR